MSYDSPKFLYNDIETPCVLYKYRDWQNPLHRRIITEREVFLAAPSTFEDQLDCRNSVRYDLLTEEQIFQKYYYDSIEMNPAFSEQEHRAFASHWADVSPLYDPSFIKEQKKRDYKEFNERIGVLCLTDNPINQQMWHKYARSSRGFAVGFRSNIFFDLVGSGGLVQYSTPLPVIMPSPWHSHAEAITMQIHHKQKHWEFEQEYRTTIFGARPLSTAERIKKVPVEAYEEIVFGALSTPQMRKKVMDIARATVPHINFKHAQVDKATGIISLVTL